MQLRCLSREDVRAAIDMTDAIEAMRQAFGALSAGTARVPLRLPLETKDGVFLFMPAHLDSVASSGAKVVSVYPGNAGRGLPAIHALVLLMDSTTGVPRALMDGTWLTALRTGAAGGLAADLLARKDATVAALFGAGVQARTQLEAARRVRPLEEVRIVSRAPESAERLAAELEGIRAVVSSDPAAAVRGADLILTATDSATPVFPGRTVDAGTHVTAVGSFTPDMQEVDTDLVGRATVVVDERRAARTEAGDLIQAVARGSFAWDRVHAELGEIVNGTRPGRTATGEVTLFKSVGNAAQDLVVAARVLEAAEARGLGTLVTL